MTVFSYQLCLGTPEIGKFEQLTVGSARIPLVVPTNPHAVILTTQHKLAWKAPKHFDYKVTGPLIETHRRFPKRTNVEFIRELKVSGKRASALVEVWERGAGATLSCGKAAR